MVSKFEELYSTIQAAKNEIRPARPNPPPPATDGGEGGKSELFFRKILPRRNWFIERAFDFAGFLSVSDVKRAGTAQIIAHGLHLKFSYWVLKGPMHPFCGIYHKFVHFRPILFVDHTDAVQLVLDPRGYIVFHPFPG